MRNLPPPTLIPITTVCVLLAGTSICVAQVNPVQLNPHRIVLRLDIDSLSLDSSVMEVNLDSAHESKAINVLADSLRAMGGVALQRAYRPDTVARRGNTMMRLGLAEYWTLSLAEAKDVKAISAHLSLVPNVLEVIPLGIGEFSALDPDDDYWDPDENGNDLWVLEQVSDFDMDANTAWDSYYGDSEQLIAVLDSGIHSGHEEFALPNGDKIVLDYRAYTDEIAELEMCIQVMGMAHSQLV
jgi:hypothetical protein